MFSDKENIQNSKVLLIIPAYNEQDSIAGTIADIRANAPEVDFVIVNDGSRDNTKWVCEELVAYNFNGVLINLPVNLGLSGAVQTGMKYAARKGYDYAIQFDADGQHLAKYIAPMVKEAQATGADIVIGSRFKNTKKPRTLRMAGSILITRMILYTTKARISDPTSGMRLFNRKMIEQFAQDCNLTPEPDTIAHLGRSGAKITEVSVTMLDRTAGESYLNISRSVVYMLRECISILFVQWFRK